MSGADAPAGNARPIGVFDSGVGGLTVLRALREKLPHEPFIYLGDTARLPYGTKSPETVVRYAIQAANALVARGVKALVIACNTASSVALPAMREHYGDLPVIGVVEPGAEAAVIASRTGQIAVIGTEATVRGGAYQRAIMNLRPEAKVRALACQVFVALAEEGWTTGPVVRTTAQQYLLPLFTAAPLQRPAPAGPAPEAPADTLVLGCTHFPVLQAAIRQVIGSQVAIVDSAATTARAAHALLTQRGLLRAADAGVASPLHFLATDGLARFKAVGARFLGHEIGAEDIELVDL